MYGRFPNPRGKGVEAEIEVRQLFELDEFGPSADIERFSGDENRTEEIIVLRLGTRSSSRWNQETYEHTN